MKYLFYSVLAICITVIVCFCIAFLDAGTIVVIAVCILGGYIINGLFQWLSGIF